MSAALIVDIDAKGDLMDQIDHEQSSGARSARFRTSESPPRGVQISWGLQRSFCDGKLSPLDLRTTNRLADRFPQTSGIGTVFGQALSEHPNQLAVCF